jgi:hypothetical protein
MAVFWPAAHSLPKSRTDSSRHWRHDRRVDVGAALHEAEHLVGRDAGDVPGEPRGRSYAAAGREARSASRLAWNALPLV